MKINSRLLVLCMTVSAILCGMFIIGVRAQGTTLTDQQIELIRSNCLSVKNTLNQLHASDALLRVNRGQIYESMSTKLMDRFNSRASNNGFGNTDLVAVTKSYGLMLDTFRLEYITYEKQLALAISIDCPNQPVEFYDAVLLARTKRSQVNADVVKLNQFIDQYQSAVNQFEKDYQASVERLKQ